MYWLDVKYTQYIVSYILGDTQEYHKNMCNMHNERCEWLAIMTVVLRKSGLALCNPLG